MTETSKVNELIPIFILTFFLMLIIFDEQEIVSIYTNEDIIYLEGNRVFSEKGIDTTLNNRLEALEFFEDLSVKHLKIK